jgi:phosphoribosyl 1,2-cyclic phosphate phosphodiesterase
MTLRLTILGCGSSGGVPRVGSGWGHCDPANPLNRRRRCAALVERIGPHGVTTVLIDAGPDLREQLLGAEVRRLDAVLITHEHADHTHGLDDLRPLVLHMRRTVDVHMEASTQALLRDRFRYLFEMPEGSSYPPIAIAHRLVAGQSTHVEGPGGRLDVLPIEIVHGDITSLAFRFGGLCYLPDVSAIPESVAEHFAGLDVWVLDALRDVPHSTHFTVREALDWIARMAPKQAVLTNLHTDLDHVKLSARLPSGVRPAHDGMVIEIADGAVRFL